MEVGLNFKETELCLSLPGGEGDTKTSGKRGFSETVDLKLNLLHYDDSDLKENVENSSSAAGEPLPLKDPVKPPAKLAHKFWIDGRAAAMALLIQSRVSEFGIDDRAAVAKLITEGDGKKGEGVNWRRRVHLKIKEFEGSI